MRLYNQNWQKGRRRRLRSEGTSAEALLWSQLKGRQLDGLRWRRQFGVGPYVLDFYCPACRLAVELDGAGHRTEEQRTYDSERTQYLQAAGIHVLRFPNRAVFHDTTRVLSTIAKAASSRQQALRRDPAA